MAVCCSTAHLPSPSPAPEPAVPQLPAPGVPNPASPPLAGVTLPLPWGGEGDRAPPGPAPGPLQGGQLGASPQDRLPRAPFAGVGALHPP